MRSQHNEAECRIYVNKLTTIDSDNGLSPQPDRYQAII